MSSKYVFAAGQRWISANEPEIGIGIIIQAGKRFVEIRFPSHNSERRYALPGAPLKRLIFNSGDIIKDRDGKTYTVTAVKEDPNSGLITYVASTIAIPETELSDSMSIATPDKRFLAGISDNCADFELRCSMVNYRSAILGSEARGFAGGRIELLPHQIFIAETVAARILPRALLADETGLGKTIEAALILHRLIRTGRVSRALLLVPETLVHQWFVELLRRFNLLCTLVTGEILGDTDETNIFLEDEMFIADMECLARSPLHAAQACKAPWDLIIIDEAHHVKSGSAESALLHELARRQTGMLLLSATPEQFGIQSHFSRLQVLDPVRFRSWEEYQQERESIQAVSDCIEACCGQQGIKADAPGIDAVRINVPASLLGRKDAPAGADGASRETSEVAIGELIDLYAMGRVQFRNTRKTVKGFPVRIVHTIAVQGNEEIHQAIFSDSDKGTESQKGTIPGGIFANDPRVIELARIVKRLRTKILVLCGKKEVAVAVQEQLKKLVGVTIALFHEDMTLIQRDRNAAWFEEEHGADVLISSESGSEGRNFQFCSHCVLFDLPLNPELLEQRIGRLDRIGQGDTITIHIPYFKGTAHEVLVRWYEEGIGCISANVPAAGEVFERLEPSFAAVNGMIQAGDFPESEMEDLLEKTRALKEHLNSTLFVRRDRLLELSSNRPAKARKMIEAIERHDRECIASRIVETLFHHYGIVIEDGGAGRYRMLTEYLTDHAFPLPRRERPMITYNRALACMRDDIEFLTIDHPMITGALDLYLSSDHGTSSFALWRDDKVKELVLECLFVLECVAPEKLYTDRFLPALPIRVVVNHQGRNVADGYSVEVCKAHCRNGPVAKLLATESITDVFSKMVQKSTQIAIENAKPLITKAIEKMDALYSRELLRLEKLAARGASLARDEWEALSAERCEAKRYLSEARTRLECLRVIRRGPVF